MGCLRVCEIDMESRLTKSNPFHFILLCHTSLSLCLTYCFLIVVCAVCGALFHHQRATESLPSSGLHSFCGNDNKKKRRRRRGKKCVYKGRGDFVQQDCKEWERKWVWSWRSASGQFLRNTSQSKKTSFISDVCVWKLRSFKTLQRETQTSARVQRRRMKWEGSFPDAVWSDLLFSLFKNK